MAKETAAAVAEKRVYCPLAVLSSLFGLLSIALFVLAFRLQGTASDVMAILCVPSTIAAVATGGFGLYRVNKYPVLKSRLLALVGIISGSLIMLWGLLLIVFVVLQLNNTNGII
jgi:hypothetical protein